MNRFVLALVILLLPPLAALHAAAAPAAPNPQAIADVAAGKRAEARASRWDFDPVDATVALQAAIHSGARTLIVEDMGAPWITDKLTLASNLKIVFEPGVVVQAKRGAIRGGGDCLFSAASKTTITLIGYGATLRMWKQDYSQSAAFHLLGTTRQFWFWVPPGTKEFGVKVSGGGGTECVKATLHGPAGAKVEEQDNIAQAHQFVATPKGAGEIWSLRFDKPTVGVLEDFYVQLQGVPPLLSPTRARGG